MNINIIFAFLDKYSPKLILNNPNWIDVEIKFTENADDENTIAIVTSGTLCADFSRLSNRQLIIIGDVDDCLISILKGNAIIIPDAMVAADDVLHTLFVGYQKFTNWQEHLLLALVRGAELQELFDIGAEIFSNPIFLEDMDSRLLCEHGMKAVSRKMPFLHELYQKGFVDTEDFIKYGSLSEENALFEAPDMTPTFLYAHRDNCTLLVTYIRTCGQRFAAFQVIELEKKITPACAEYAKIFSEVLEKHFSKDFDGATEPRESKNAVTELIRGVPVSGEAAANFLSGNGWEKNAEYVIAVMEWSQKIYGTPYTRQRLLLDLKSQFPNTAVALIDRKFFVLACTSNTDLTEFRSELADAAVKNHLHIASSQRFYDILNVKKHFAECEYGLSEIDGDSNDRVIEFAEYAPSLLHRFLTLSESSYGSIAVAQLELLKELESGKGASYIQTLYSYIASGFNLSATATRLGIHRNTLSYRLERIETILGYKISRDTLTDTEILEHLLSCYLILFEQRHHDVEVL